MAIAILQKVVAATEIPDARNVYGNDRRYRCLSGTIRFVDWMMSRRTSTTPRDLMDHFGISRATAYRWLGIYADARGIPWPPSESGIPPKRAPLRFAIAPSPLVERCGEASP